MTEELPIPSLLLITESALKEKDVTEALEEEYDIRCLRSTAEALEALRYYKPDLILVDEKTEDFHVENFINSARSFEGYGPIPIIIISNVLKKSHSRALHSAGATNVLQEPIDKELLLAAVEKHRDKKHTRGKVDNFSQYIPTFSITSAKERLAERLIINEKVHQVLTSAEQHRDNVSLLIVEIDQYEDLFKAYGKKLGKLLLFPFEKHLRKLIRPQDIITRLEGGRFVIILPKTSPSAVNHIASDIQDFLQQSPFTTEGLDCEITASIGHANAEHIDEGKTREKLDFLIQSASKCLTEAKLQGNKIVSRFSNKKG